MAASNQCNPEAVKLLIDAYPDSLHLQNDDGMTPLDLALADESASETLVALLEGRPPPPELTRRQKADKFLERADALERKLGNMRDAGGRQHGDLREAIQAVRRLADRFPHALYSAGIDPNELEIALSNSLAEDGMGHGVYGGARPNEAEMVILDAVKGRSPVANGVGLRASQSDGQMEGGSAGGRGGPRDRVEDLLASIVGLDHVKSQVSNMKRLFQTRTIVQLLLFLFKTDANISLLLS